jgi:predicted MFS family arabinose efflux permease
LALGIIKCFDSPALQSFTKEVVGTEDLPNAVALTAATVAFARMVGPAIGGLLFVVASPAICFYLNASSFLVSLLALIAIDVGKLYPGTRAPRASGQVAEGLRYVRGKRVLVVTLVAIFVVAAAGYNFQVLLPIVASNALNGGADLYGELMSMLGVGALIGSLFMASRVRPTLLGLAFWCAALAVGEIGLSLSFHRAEAFAAALAMGVASASFTITASSILQINTVDGFRGRVMSLYTTAFFGSGCIGAPVAGGLAQYFGVRVALTVAAIGCLVVASTVTFEAKFGRSGRS